VSRKTIRLDEFFIAAFRQHGSARGQSDPNTPATNPAEPQSLTASPSDNPVRNPG
jgi:hypothetical protein